MGEMKGTIWEWREYPHYPSRVNLYPQVLSGEMCVKLHTSRECGKADLGRGALTSLSPRLLSSDFIQTSN